MYKIIFLTRFVGSHFDGNWISFYFELRVKANLLLIDVYLFSLASQGYYLASSRELTRFDSITKAPVIHHFSESIAGVMTIRSFRKQEKFVQENVNRVNSNLRLDFHNNGSNEWLGFRLEFLGSIILCLSTLFMIILPSSIIKPGNLLWVLVGYLVVFKLNIELW